MWVSKDFIHRNPNTNPYTVKIAGNITAEFFSYAIETIDAKLGKGYAKSHPDSISGLVQNMGVNYSSQELCLSLHEIEISLTELVRAVYQTNNSLDCIGSVIEQSSIYEQMKDIAEKLSNLHGSFDVSIDS